MKKSVVLQAVDGKEKAVLSMENKEDMIVGRLRLYNFNEEPKGILSLGFNSNGKVVKAGLTKASEMLYTFQTDIDNINEKFSCAVVNSYQGGLSPLLYGASDGKPTQEEMLAGALKLYEKPLSVQNVEKEIDENEIEYDEELQEEIESAIEENFVDKSKEFEEKDIENRCENCKYRKCFYESENKVPSFYSKLKNQLDRLFDNNPEEEFLCKIIPNSKWVKVEYEKNGDYYVIGLIYENQELAYLCYGVPAVYQKTPPEELSGYPVWLPLDSTRKEGFGYWLVYQNAENGENIKAIID